MTTDKKLRYMQTQVWEGKTYDGMRDVFSSLYAHDGAHTHDEAMDALLKNGDDASSLLIDLLYDQAILTDRYIADCLLPLGDHLQDWHRNAKHIQHLIEDARRACEVMDFMVEGIEDYIAPDQQARDGYASEAEVPQRLLAYDAVFQMVNGTRGDMCVKLHDVAQATLTNIVHDIELELVSLRSYLSCEAS